ncbi:phosphatase PAP2 family protein [bacterium]|nr:phosphatase PAP2 family protein [bacterium]NBX72108.1 phosphatase PAP2 family protein [bacterium]
MKNFILGYLILLAYTLNALDMPHDRYTGLTLAGDILSTGLPVSAIGLSLMKNDSILVKQTVTGSVLLLYSTDVLKKTFNATSLGRRPNGFPESFPSGHSSAAFYGAIALHRVAGLELAVPAYGLAFITGYSRVEGHYHHWRDVAAGAMLALAVDRLSLYATEYSSSQLISKQSFNLNYIDSKDRLNNSYKGLRLTYSF